MNITFIKQEKSQHLILIMAGWGMDPSPFMELDRPGYDMAVIWDYTNEALDVSQLSNYREIVLLAWSMGVMEASRAIPVLKLPVSLTVAINGTMTPVNDTTGIPVAIFDGTLRSMSIDNMARFNRRMCGSAASFRDFQLHSPQRSIESLHDELQALGQRAVESKPYGSMRWDMAVTGTRDMIFPYANQAKAWNGYNVLTIDEPHLPDFQSIIDRLTVDKKRVAERFSDTRDSYDRSATHQQAMAQSLSDLLISTCDPYKPMEHAIEIGAANGQLTAFYIDRLNIGTIELWDLSSPCFQCKNSDTSIKCIADDAEARLFEITGNSTDLVVSASTLQWFNSPCNALRQIERILKPGGTAAISLYTQGTYRLFASETGVSINYTTPEALKQALSSNCDILHLSTDCKSESFPSTRQLIDHMRLTGVNAAGSSSTSTLRRLLKENTLRQLEYNSTTLIFTKR